MGKPQYTKGAFLIHNQQRIHDEQEQANIFSETWAKIMTPNILRNAIEIQEHIQTINNWYIQNREQINLHNIINLNNLNRHNKLTKPITVAEEN